MFDLAVRVASCPHDRKCALYSNISSSPRWGYVATTINPPFSARLTVLRDGCVDFSLLSVSSNEDTPLGRPFRLRQGSRFGHTSVVVAELTSYRMHNVYSEYDHVDGDRFLRAPTAQIPPPTEYIDFTAAAFVVFTILCIRRVFILAVPTHSREAVRPPCDLFINLYIGKIGGGGRHHIFATKTRRFWHPRREV